MAKTIVGLFDSRDAAERVVDDLVAQGCSRSDIEVSAADEAGAATAEPRKEGGFLSWLFGDEDEDRDTYHEGIRRGRTAVAVDAEDEREETVAAIMERHGPLNLNTESARWRQEGWLGSAGRSSEESIPVVKEEVGIGKRAVERGGLRIYSRVVERPVAEDVTLRDEKVNVERRPVDRPLAAGEAAFQDRVIEKRETQEEPVISKTARVVEEVALSKEERERKQRVEDTERHTEVEVEHLKGSEKPGDLHRRP
jgi:uncharacterized protein (TIGR02271 family)